MGIEKTRLVKLVKGYTVAEAGRQIDLMLRVRGVVGDPFGKPAIAALVRSEKIAASFSVGSVEVPAAAIEAPAVIDVPGMNISVAISIVTGGQIAQLVANGYEIEGDNIRGLKKKYEDKYNVDKGIGCLSKDDGDALALAINRQNPGRSFRLPTEKEVEAIFKTMVDQVSGIGQFWIATSDERNPDSGPFVFRHLTYDYCNDHYPGCRFDNCAVVLVEDKK